MSDVPREFVFTRYPGAKGIVWLRAAYAMWKQHRMPWVFLIVAYFLILLFLQVIPYIGPLVMTIMNPVFAVGLLAAAWNQERGATPAMRHLFQGFRANVWALLAIGVVLAVAVRLAVFASSLVDAGKFVDVLANGASMTEEQLAARVADAQFQFGVMFSAALSLPIVIVTWWASALVVFQDAGAGAAIATSLRAALANWKALLVYGLGVFVYGGLVPSLIVTLGLVVPSAPLQLLVIAILLPYLLIFAVTLHVSHYVSYRDVFHANETLAPLSRSA
jgi:hypothetical protein